MIIAAAVLAALEFLSPENIRAQGRGQVIMAGSTVQGDILRGEGIAAMGIGQGNLANAMATSINVDTSIRWNQYVYLSIQEDLRQKAIHREANRLQNLGNYNARLTRIKVNPDQIDLRKGAALNAVQLAELLLHP